MMDYETIDMHHFHVVFNVVYLIHGLYNTIYVYSILVCVLIVIFFVWHAQMWEAKLEESGVMNHPPPLIPKNKVLYCGISCRVLRISMYVCMYMRLYMCISDVNHQLFLYHISPLVIFMI